MPIYEYICKKCGKELEVLQKISDPAPVCEACDAGAMEKKMSLTSFQLKGGGWYTDGYSSTSATKKETTSNAATSTSETSTKKTDSSSKASSEK